MITIKNLINAWKSFKSKRATKQEAKNYRVKPEPLDPKEAATAKQEPYVSVLTTHVNKENIRNGFFELDWNEFFIIQLREAGYRGDSEEAIVDAWFKDLCRDVAMEEQVTMDRRGAGFINVTSIGNGRSEIS
jgi:hypothetical protein